VLDLAVAALSGILHLGPPPRPDIALPTIPSISLATPGPAVYRPEDKSVSTWRDGTFRTLEPLPLAAAAAAFNLGRPVVSRCVKLNNPWCIKRARWQGEIGGDEEGHTAFASTEAGADAAASLLRGYYVAYGRKSALDIVRRWAPAECKLGIPGMSVSLAIGGLQNTLRARYLAATGGRGGGRPTVTRTKRGVAIKAPPGGRVRVSVVPLAKMPSYRVPGLIAGGGERAGAARETTSPRAARPAFPTRTAAASAPAKRMAAPRQAAAAPIPSGCGSEEGRIQAYAGAIARALGVPPGSDLKLFDEAGQPTVNLLPVMVAMSAVELGYLHAGPELAEGAIERLKLRLAEEAARNAAAEQENRMDGGGR
jgi:hypothetical protein